jgi:hypothetical protein
MTIDAPSLHSICNPEFDEKGPLLGKVVKLDKTVGDVAGRRRTIVKLELLLLVGDEDPRSFTNVYRLQAFNHHHSEATCHAVMSSQQLDCGDNDSLKPSGLNADVDDFVTRISSKTTEDCAPSIELESTIDRSLSDSPPVSKLLSLSPPLQRPLSSAPFERPSSRILVQREIPPLRSPPQFPTARQPPSPSPSLVLRLETPPSRTRTPPPTVGDPPSPSSSLVLRLESPPSRAHTPPPTVGDPPSPSPSLELQLHSLLAQETPPSPTPTQFTTVGGSPLQFPSQQSSACSRKITLLVQNPTPPPDSEESSSHSAQELVNPTLADGEGNPYSLSTEEATSLAHCPPPQGHAVGDESLSGFEPDVQSSPHSAAVSSAGVSSATTPPQIERRVTRSSTSKNAPQERMLTPPLFGDAILMEQEKTNKRKLGTRKEKDSAHQRKRARFKRNGVDSAACHDNRMQEPNGGGIEDLSIPNGTLSSVDSAACHDNRMQGPTDGGMVHLSTPNDPLRNLAKQFSTAIRLGGRVSQEPGGRTLPIHLTEPTRSHSTTLQELLKEQQAHAAALTSRASIANMTYSWCLIGEKYQSEFIGVSRVVDCKKEARLRRCGSWIISILNRVNFSLRKCASNEGTENGGLDAYKIPAALAGEYAVFGTDGTEADRTQLHLEPTLMPSPLHASLGTTPQKNGRR